MSKWGVIASLVAGAVVLVLLIFVPNLGSAIEASAQLAAALLAAVAAFAAADAARESRLASEQATLALAVQQLPEVFVDLRGIVGQPVRVHSWYFEMPGLSPTAGPQPFSTSKLALEWTRSPVSDWKRQEFFGGKPDQVTLDDVVVQGPIPGDPHGRDVVHVELDQLRVHLTDHRGIDWMGTGSQASVTSLPDGTYVTVTPLHGLSGGLKDYGESVRIHLGLASGE